MKMATLKQAGKVLKLLENVPAEQLQNVLASGLLYDLLRANVDGMMDRMDRNEFRKLCGLVPVFSTWKTIKIGIGLKTADDFCQALDNGGFKINNWAKDIFKSPEFTAVNEENELDLVKATVAELGFETGALRSQVYTRVKELGFEICPLEVGPQLRLQYQDQPNNEWIFIAMEPILVSDEALRVFSVGRSCSGLWLGSCYGHPDYFFQSYDLLVFLRPRK